MVFWLLARPVLAAHKPKGVTKDLSIHLLLVCYHSLRWHIKFSLLFYIVTLFVASCMAYTDRLLNSLAMLLVYNILRHFGNNWWSPKPLIASFSAIWYFMMLWGFVSPIAEPSKVGPNGEEMSDLHNSNWCSTLGCFFCSFLAREDCRSNEDITLQQQSGEEDVLFCTLCNAEVSMLTQKTCLCLYITAP